MPSLASRRAFGSTASTGRQLGPPSRITSGPIATWHDKPSPSVSHSQPPAESPAEPAAPSSPTSTPTAPPAGAAGAPGAEADAPVFAPIVRLTQAPAAPSASAPLSDYRDLFKPAGAYGSRLSGISGGARGELHDRRDPSGHNHRHARDGRYARDGARADDDVRSRLQSGGRLLLRQREGYSHERRGDGLMARQRGGDESPPRLRLALERAIQTAADRNESEYLYTYRPAVQADWARQRLLGSAATATPEEVVEADERGRVRCVLALGWSASPGWVEPELIDRLEEAVRTRLGTLTSSLGSSPRAARALLAEATAGSREDAQALHEASAPMGHFKDYRDAPPYESSFPQSGVGSRAHASRPARVTLAPFVEMMGRKLNYEFPARGSAPSSRAVLAALFRRYDVGVSGAVPCEDFHAALCGRTPTARAIRAIGRLREGLVSRGGGFDALRIEAARWLKCRRVVMEANAKLGDTGAREPTAAGCVSRQAFGEGIRSLAALCHIGISEAEINILADTFEPPDEALDGGGGGRGGRGGGVPVGRVGTRLVSYEELVLAVRGPGMTTARQQQARARVCSVLVLAPWGGEVARGFLSAPPPSLPSPPRPDRSARPSPRYATRRHRVGCARSTSPTDTTSRPTRPSWRAGWGWRRPRSHSCRCGGTPTASMRR